MSLYNAVFGQNPLSDTILATLNLTRSDVGRFRDCFVANGEIAVYTRNGGGNREHWDSAKTEGANCNCYACAIGYRLPAHPNYLRDQDDDFDCTYATIYFGFPERYREFLEALNTQKFDPSQRWVDYFEAMRSPDYVPPPQIEALMGKLKESLERGEGGETITV